MREPGETGPWRDEAVRPPGVVSVAGVEVHIEGEGSETLVMVHGWPDTYRLWDAQVQALADRFRCVRFTLPGFDDKAERRAYFLDEILSTLLQVVDSVSPSQPVVLLLHDWGCTFGYEFYRRHPHRVSRIIGVDIGDPISWRASSTLGTTAFVVGYQVWLALAWLLPGPIGDRITRSTARRAGCPVEPAQIRSRMNYPYFVRWFGGRNSYRRHQGPFEPACPLLFVYGRRKPILFHAHAWAEALASRPGNQVVEFDTGHWVMSDQPERFNEVVRAWLAA